MTIQPVTPRKKTSPAELRASERFLLELTSLPTAAGHEEAVTAFVERWVARRRARLALTRDRYGNLIIARRGFKKACAKKAPLFITAHLDHPAFVVRSAPVSAVVELEFRGGVQDAYFKGADIEIFDRELRRAFPARIAALCGTAKPFKTASARLARPSSAAHIKAGCMARWKFPRPSIVKGILRTHSCDDLAGVAAALQAFDTISREEGLAHVALLFTRAEEIGFVGAIGAARGGTIPKGARLLCLECSRSFPHDSPIGSGPIVRVGDRLSVFTPALTNSVADIAAALQKADPAFRFQRRLMPGGACEATAFAGYGVSSTCLCLPLGNYHNMADIDGVAAGKKARVAQEYISTADFHALVYLLAAIAKRLDQPGPSIRDSMEKIWAEHGCILDPCPA
jgi:endoglucanase